jgi:phage FluMu gp28-like protein
MTETVQTDFDNARSVTGACPREAGVLLPYQAKWCADQSPVKVCEKSRRVGLSWAEAADSVLWASESGNGEKRNVWYIGYNKDMAIEFINDCGNWARAYNLAASEMEEYEETDEEEYEGVVSERKIQAFRITLASGWRITALSSRPSNLRGKQGRVILDEAAFHEQLDQLLKAAMALLIWGGQVHIISTHFGDSNPFNALIQDIRAGKVNYSLHRVTFDEALEQGLYRRICEVLKREWTPELEAKWRQDVIDFYRDDADEELFCIPSQGTGVWITRAAMEAIMSPDIPVIRYAKESSFAQWPDHLREAEVRDWCEATLKPLLMILPTDRNSFFGEDFGRTGDLTDITPMQEQQKATFKVPFIVELRNIPFKQQEQILFYVVDRLPRFRHGALDARGNGQYLAERAMQRYGASRISQVMLSETWYRENMPKYKAAIEDKSFMTAKDADILEDHRFIKVIKGVAKIPEGRTKGADKQQRHGDSAISGAMAWFATYQEAPVDIEYQSTGKRRAVSRMGGYLS